MSKKTPLLIQELQDKCKKIHYSRKLLNIRTKTREENSQTQGVLHSISSFQMEETPIYTKGFRSKSGRDNKTKLTFLIKS